MIKYKNISFVFPILKKTKFLFGAGIIGMIISSILTAPIPYLIGQTIDDVLLTNKNYNELYKISILLAAIYVIRYFLSIVYQYFFTKVQQTIINEIRISMVNKVIDAPLSFLNTKEKGYILGRISESGSIGSLFSPTFLGTFTGIFDLIFSLIIMINLSVKLTMLVLIIIPIYYFISKKSSRKISESTTNVFETSAVLNGEVYEMLNGLEDIKLLNGKDTQVEKLKNKLVNTIKSFIKQNLNFVLFVQNIILTNSLVTVLVLLISGILILQDQLTIGIYTSFSLYLTTLLATTQSLGSLEITLKPILVSIERIKEFLTLNSEDADGSQSLNGPIESITFKGVSFKYNNQSDEIIKNFNSEISKGDKVLLRGSNGSGKTTLIKLITGLYLPTKGTVLINGQDISSINKKTIRDKVGIVSQNIFLFKGTILENILYGQKDKTKQDVVDLIEKYNLTDYIKGLEKGLETEVVQNGIGISGGQAQLIAFLRAIIKRRDLIILDEATSNLDQETKLIILGILEKSELCNILITISHQNEGLNFVNKIIELEKHNLSEQNVETLNKKRGGMY
ncbi:multidrug ABC transporter ATP-binding protein [Bacillus cereus]|nr:multidrug ABC transporter ATP-binding protein [Bacillus cereus]